MKKLLVATVLSLCVSSAFAAETAVLKVTGTLTNSACTPELSNGGVVDYGIIRLGELSSTSNNQLGQKEIGLTITVLRQRKSAGVFLTIVPIRVLESLLAAERQVAMMLVKAISYMVSVRQITASVLVTTPSLLEITKSLLIVHRAI